MKYLALLLTIALVACGSDASPTPSVDAGPDATTTNDAGSDASTPLDANLLDASLLDASLLDANVMDANTDSGASDAGALDASSIDASLTDAPASGDGGISDEVRAFAATFAAADANFIEGTCLCEYGTFGFKTLGDCTEALAGEPLSDCYLTEYTRHWTALEPRLTCFADAANAYGDCMDASACDEGAASACDDAYYASFDTCLAIAEEEAAAADAVCSL